MPQKQSTFLKVLSIITLYLIYLFDIASIVIVLVIFSSFLLNPENLFLPATTSIHIRNTLLGFLFAAYPATQFLGAPILGELSDRLNRKLIINISILFTVFSYFLTAASIITTNLPLLFLSRLIGGFFAGNASLAQATVSNLISKKNRTRAMTLFTILAGFAWIIGPFLGSLLSNPKLVSWFSSQTPFWFLGFVFLIFWGLFLLSYQNLEIKKDKEKLSIRNCFKNLLSIFKSKIIVGPFIASLTAMFGWMIVQNFFAPFLTLKFSFTENQLGYAYAYVSVWWLFGGLISFFLFKAIRPSNLITLTTLIAAIFVFIYTMVDDSSFIYWACAIANASFAMSLSAFVALFAHLLPPEMQGKLYGSRMGGFALANTLAPALAGWISFLGVNIPFCIASITLIFSVGIYFSWHQRHKVTLNHHET